MPAWVGRGCSGRSRGRWPGRGRSPADRAPASRATRLRRAIMCRPHRLTSTLRIAHGVTGCQRRATRCPAARGAACSDLGAAQSAAVRLSGELLRESPVEYRSAASWIVRVRDASGCILFSLRLQADGALKAKPASTDFLTPSCRRPYADFARPDPGSSLRCFDEVGFGRRCRPANGRLPQAPGRSR